MENPVRMLSDIIFGKRLTAEAQVAEKMAAYKEESRQAGIEPLPEKQLKKFAKDELIARPSVKDSYLKD